MCAGSPSKSKSGDSDLSFNPQRRVSSKKGKEGRGETRAASYFFAEEKKRKVATFFQIKRKREGNLVTAHRRQIAGPSSRYETVGHFSPAASQKKRRRNTEKGGKKPSLPQNSYTPFSTLTLIVPSILRNFLRTSTTSQT